MNFPIYPNEKYFKLISLAKQYDQCQNDLLHYNKIDKKGIENNISSYPKNEEKTGNRNIDPIELTQGETTFRSFNIHHEEKNEEDNKRVSISTNHIKHNFKISRKRQKMPTCVSSIIDEKKIKNKYNHTKSFKYDPTHPFKKIKREKKYNISKISEKRLLKRHLKLPHYCRMSKNRGLKLKFSKQIHDGKNNRQKKQCTNIKKEKKKNSVNNYQQIDGNDDKINKEDTHLQKKKFTQNGIFKSKKNEYMDEKIKNSNDNKTDQVNEKSNVTSNIKLNHSFKKYTKTKKNKNSDSSILRIYHDPKKKSAKINNKHILEKCEDKLDESDNSQIKASDKSPKNDNIAKNDIISYNELNLNPPILGSTNKKKKKKYIRKSMNEKCTIYKKENLELMPSKHIVKKKKCLSKSFKYIKNNYASPQKVHALTNNKKKKKNSTQDKFYKKGNKKINHIIVGKFNVDKYNKTVKSKKKNFIKENVNKELQNANANTYKGLLKALNRISVIVSTKCRKKKSRKKIKM
ncbi:conserved Plasmodium protein, unknown function [Plasmodium yoelii]|uniref:Uncharacterized protein n=3 Tax=Plasmodium yoelii TaxID=5861 RepID=A0AAE9WKT5_PLAYO|nr:conserved Plasmodium protein, unknown function [Plasmodium yoelii]EAA22113.1 hypothetical protein [Plasmodium yoelii yoelii]WBY55525.1 hypothetical protein Py17XNL_000504388 [Plasmodium yoelii yoelii]CDU16619.1 conserved Plasmodium protein, unknown function [Plasmodium yoelii]VTZ74062.1 conserved Plasmodium protein, unknown function [Plasmodium yoelii]|eukprot:XP_730548.1 conserved Plasmodium protein, unknown function [Plasmodium yoelii]